MEPGDYPAVVHVHAQPLTTHNFSQPPRIQRHQPQALAALPRMTGASAEEEIDKPAGRFLQPCDDVACFELFTYLSRAIIRQSAKFDRGGDGQPAEPARVSGLSERYCSHWGPIRKAMRTKTETPSRIDRPRRSRKSVLFEFQIWDDHQFRKECDFSATPERGNRQAEIKGR